MTAEFRHAFAHQVMVTEILRIKALIVVGTVLILSLTAAWAFLPTFVDEIWRKNFNLGYLYAMFLPFVAFELFVLDVIRRRMAQGRDVSAPRRYLSVLIETSLPTIGLAVQMSQMGPGRALGFVIPLSYFIFIILSTLRLDFWLSTATGFVAASELLLMATYYPSLYFPDDPASHDVGYHVARSLMLFAGGVVAGAVGLQLRRQFVAAIAAASARDTVTNLFGQHVSPQVVERLLASQTTDVADLRNVAVMFVDIRGFTAAARRRPPELVVRRLDDAFAVLVDIVDRNGGIVNKFLGDGFLAVFGAPFDDPNAAERAVTAGREMLKAMERDNAASDWPLRIGIGIHLGEVVAGNIGSPRRKEYTVIGDTVNFAARLEQLNKEFESQLLVSGSVFESLESKEESAVALGGVAVRGYEAPQQVWRLA